MTQRFLRSTVATILLAVSLAGCHSAKSVADQSPQSEPMTERAVGDVAASDSTDLDHSIPLDPTVIVGHLDNGLTYYVRHNDRPTDRAELRLVVNAGSILESDAQVGLAHFVEHMAFNGTERFHKQELVDYLESIGVRFGADLNAYTSFDETVYMLQVPTDSVEQLDTGIQILREWASRVQFEDEEIEKERGVVIEEWRLGRGANARIQDKEFPVLLKGSRYPDRLPIGTKENLETFDPSLLKQFYHDWYRPDLLAVVVVGDVDAQRIEALIRAEFGNLSSRPDAPERRLFPIPDHEETLVSTVADPEAPVKSISVLFKGDDPDADVKVLTNRILHQQFVEGLYSSMLNSRLEELTQSENPPFFGAGAGFGTFGRSKKLYSVTAIPGEAGYVPALQAALVEIERIKRFGFLQSELDRAKNNLLRSYERAFAERDKTESRRYASEYVNNFLEREPIPGIGYEYKLARSYVPAIELSEVNAIASSVITRGNRVLLVSGPEVEGEPLPEDSELLGVFDAVESQSLEPFTDRETAGELLDVLPAPGQIVSESVDDAVGVHHLVLSNGAEVYLKSTDFKNDQVLVTAWSPGGTSLTDDSLDVPADFASSLVALGGVGRFGPIELQKKLAGKAVQVTPSITERREAIGGSSSPDDLETMFQLLHLYFTAPRADTVAYRSFVTRYRSLLENMDVDPDRAFYDTLSTTLSQHHPRRRPLTLATLDELDLGESFAIFRDRFADASDFKFFVVGALDSTDVRGLIEKYIASLPALHRTESPRDLGIRPPAGKVVREIHRGTEPKSRVQIVLTGPAEYSQENRRLMRLVEGLLDIRLREVLREDKGGTYGVSVSGSLQDEPVESFQFSIGFGCAPDRVDELVQTAYDELERFKSEAPSAEDLHKVIETTFRQHQVGLKQNGYWLSSISYYVDQELPLEGILEGGESFYNKVTPEQIRVAAEEYLSTKNQVRVTLNPVE